jgi:hypothetical protein
LLWLKLRLNQRLISFQVLSPSYSEKIKVAPIAPYRVPLTKTMAKLDVDEAEGLKEYFKPSINKIADSIRRSSPKIAEEFMTAFDGLEVFAMPFRITKAIGGDFTLADGCTSENTTAVIIYTAQEIVVSAPGFNEQDSETQLAAVVHETYTDVGQLPSSERAKIGVAILQAEQLRLMISNVGLGQIATQMEVSARRLINATEGVNTIPLRATIEAVKAHPLLMWRTARQFRKVFEPYMKAGLISK